MTRVYEPVTMAGLAALRRDGGLPATPGRFVASDDSEEQEYAALMAAADASAALLDGAGRRVVVVAELADPDGPLTLREVVAVHADREDRPVDADPDEELGWYAVGEIEGLLSC